MNNERILKMDRIPKEYHQPYYCILSKKQSMPKKLEVEKCWIEGNNVKFSFLSKEKIPNNKYYLYSVVNYGMVHDARKDYNGNFHSLYEYYLQGFRHYYCMPILHINNEKQIIHTRSTLIHYKKIENK